MTYSPPPPPPPPPEPPPPEPPTPPPPPPEPPTPPPPPPEPPVPPQRGPHPWQRWREPPVLTPRRVTGVVVGVIAVMFVAENTRGVKVRMLIPEVTVPLWTVFACGFVLGIVLGVLIWRRGPRPS
jgi:hypothetical protein